MSIQVSQIVKTYQEQLILDNVSFEVQTGELVALLGPSGSGKTTLLRIIAGLEYADSGKVLFQGEETQTTPIQERKVGFVFQHYALFKHMTVFENAAFGLKVRPRKSRPTTSQIRKKISALLELMHLESFQHHYPNQLSGGQQQRVALVRALAIDPKVLLLDEPFGALDAKVRKELCRFMRVLHNEIKVSSIFVTHDQEEALDVADRVGIMNEGRLAQLDTPVKLWQHPQDNFVFSFIGNVNEFAGWVDNNEQLYLTLPSDTAHLSPVKLYARPHEITLSSSPTNQPTLKAQINFVNTTGSLVKIELYDEYKHRYVVEIPHAVFLRLNLNKDDWAFISPQKIFRFDKKD